MTTTEKFLRLIAEHLIAVTTEPQARLALIRTAARRPITGGPVHGWHA